MESNRVAPSPMEPRACMVSYDAAQDHYTLLRVHAGRSRRSAASSRLTPALPTSKFTIEARDVGGGFGQRSVAYPEYLRADDGGEADRQAGAMGVARAPKAS